MRFVYKCNIAIKLKPNRQNIVWAQIDPSAFSKYSQLSLNGHLYKTDTSIRRTPGAGPGRFSVILL